MNPKILAVDDDLLILQAMQLAFKNTEFQLEVADSFAAALEQVRRNPIGFSLVFVDHHFKATNEKGSELARKIKEINPTIMVVMVSGERSEETLKSWLEAGVDQFLIKPTEPFELLSIAENARSRYIANYGGLARNEKSIRDSKQLEALRLTELIGASMAIGRVAEQAILFASNPYNVLILGETGTGKEVVATAIHKNSSRAKKPFLPINCSGFRGNENLLESELFGHEKGAFTGADKLKKGVFEDARGGTVFLDEIHHLSDTAQAKLLRAIERKKIRRVGGSVELDVDFRLIAAGKPELKEMILSGSFMPDLYYRVKDLLIEIPPLRERREDIIPLVRHYKAVYEHDLGRKVEIVSGALEALEAHSWSGNVRELAAVIKELLVTTKRSVIRVEDLPAILREKAHAIQGNQHSLAVLLFEQERQQRDLIIKALVAADNNVTQASLALGVPRSTVRDLMRKFNITDAVVAATRTNGVKQAKGKQL